MQMQQISRAVCDQQRTPQVPEDAPAPALLCRCFERRPTQRPTAANLAEAFASDVREGVTLALRLVDQEAITEEVTRVNSRLTQENARLQREVEALKDVRRQGRELQENVRQLTQENPRLQKEVEGVRRQERALQGKKVSFINENTFSIDNVFSIELDLGHTTVISFLYPLSQRRCHPREALYLPTFSHLFDCQ
jgi:N12 class adenine-specific DNA methylase